MKCFLSLAFALLSFVAFAAAGTVLDMFDAKTPPMLLLHGDEDYYSPMGSVALYRELHKRKIPA